MIINEGNIQKWCFDYFEGNLTYLEKIEMEQFVLKNPQHHQEFSAWRDSYNQQPEEETPKFVPAAALFATIPFYETLLFKGAVAATLILSAFFGGIYISGVDDLIGKYNPGNQFEYLSEYGFSNSFNQFDSKSLINKTNNNSEVRLNDGTYFESTNSVLNEFAQNSIQDNVSGANHTIGLLNNENLDDLTIYDFTSEEIALNFLNEIEFTKNRNKYAFLNFNDKNSINNSKIKFGKQNKKNHKGNDNLAIIQQTEKEGKVKSNAKKKKKLFSNLKYIELGLGNINDPLFAVPNGNIGFINPAVAGQLGFTRLKMSYRNQWTSDNTNSFTIGKAYADTYFAGINAGMGIGIDYLHGLGGDLKGYSMSYVYSQKFTISKDANVAVGLEYNLATVDFQENLNQQFVEFNKDRVESSNFFAQKDKKYEHNIGLSSWFSGKYFFGGINVTNLLGNTLTGVHEGNKNYLERINYSMQIGTDYKRTALSNTVLSPYAMFSKKESHNELWAGLTLRHKVLVTGVAVSDQLSAKAILGIQNNKLRVTYGYDYSKSEMMNEYAGSHELSLRLLLGNKTNNWSTYGD